MGARHEAEVAELVEVHARQREEQRHAALVRQQHAAERHELATQQASELRAVEAVEAVGAMAMQRMHGGAGQGELALTALLHQMQAAEQARLRKHQEQQSSKVREAQRLSSSGDASLTSLFPTMMGDTLHPSVFARSSDDQMFPLMPLRSLCHRGSQCLPDCG